MESAALPLLEKRHGVIAILGWLRTADTLGAAFCELSREWPERGTDPLIDRPVDSDSENVQ